MPRNQNLFSGEKYEPITPADADLTQATRRIMVGVAGTLVLTRLDKTVVTLNAIAGQSFDVVATRIASTSTATSITAIY